jgi:2-dehydropantoate 2-reductase
MEKIMKTPDSPLLIVGTGALASLFAARLAAAGLAVKMLGTWPEGLRALRAGGVRLVEPDGREIQARVQVAEDPSACRGTRFALVLVKSWQTARAARQLRACLAEDGLALTLQNGLGNREALAQALGAARVALGVTTTGASLLNPGWVRLAGNGAITLGEHPRLGPLAVLLGAAGFTVETVADTSSLLWGKLVVNAAINPLTALLDAPNGELLARPAGRALLAAVANEAAAVAAALGVRLPYPDPVAAVEDVARRTGANFSSMLRDVQRGAPTEIDAINGAIVQAGERAGVPVPLNRALWLLIKSVEKRAKTPADHRPPTVEILHPERKASLHAARRPERKRPVVREKIPDVQIGK